MTRVGLLLLIVLTGCTSRVLEIGDGEVRDDCRWTVTVDSPAVITIADLERCLGDLAFTVITEWP